MLVCVRRAGGETGWGGGEGEGGRREKEREREEEEEDKHAWRMLGVRSTRGIEYFEEYLVLLRALVV